MTILVIGGTGQTGLKLAKLLHASNYAVLVTSRAGVAPEPLKAVKFDWFAPSTFENPFKADPNIDKVYLIPPQEVNPLPLVKPFVDLAISKGVKRIVLLSAAHSDEGGSVVGKVHEYIAHSGLEYTVLRPTWFIDNFGGVFYQSIQENNIVPTATQDGRIAFVSANDIAKAAYDALVVEKSPNTDYYLVGPDLLNYNQATAMMSEIVGREITHKQLQSEEGMAFFVSLGMTAEYAAFMVNEIEASVARGEDEAFVGTSKTITGSDSLRDYFERNKHLWIRS